MTEKKQISVTTTVHCTNTKPYVSHALEIIGADVIARAKRQLGYDVLFQAGVNEHGQEIADAAYRAETGLKTYVDKIAKLFHITWDALDVSYDQFVHIADVPHQRGVELGLPKRIIVPGRIRPADSFNMIDDTINPFFYLGACQSNADPLRYYLMREIDFEQGGVFNLFIHVKRHVPLARNLLKLRRRS